ALRNVRLPVPLLPRLRPEYHAAARAGVHHDRKGPARLHQPTAHERPLERAGGSPSRRVRGPAGSLLADARPAVPPPGRLGQAPRARSVSPRPRRLGAPRSRRAASPPKRPPPRSTPTPLGRDARAP